MAFASAQDSRAAVALLNFSGYAKDFQFAWTTDSLEVTTLADRPKVFIIGQDSSTAQSGMYLDVSGASNAQWDALTDMKAGTAVPVTFGPWGISSGSVVIMPQVLESQVAASSANAGVAEAAFSSISTGATDVGAVVENFTAVTTDTTGTARDFTASSSNGGCAHLHVSAFSGLTSDAITIEHSVDGSTSWATLVTFTTVTGVTSQRVEVPVGTTIRRYLRVVDDVTGTGSITRLVAFARR